jgi:membrane-associated phospholipid phosphatase
MASLAVTAVALSRLVLDEHWLSDIAAGVLLGAAVSASCNHLHSATSLGQEPRAATATD